MDPSIGGLPLQKGAHSSCAHVLPYRNRLVAGGATQDILSLQYFPTSTFGQAVQALGQGLVAALSTDGNVAAFPPVGLTILPIFASSVVLPYNLPELGSHVLVYPLGLAPAC